MTGRSHVYFSDHVLRRLLGYYLVTPPKAPHEDKLARLRDWLLSGIGEGRQGGADA